MSKESHNFNFDFPGPLLEKLSIDMMNLLMWREAAIIQEIRIKTAKIIDQNRSGAAEKIKENAKHILEEYYENLFGAELKISGDIEDAGIDGVYKGYMRELEKFISQQPKNITMPQDAGRFQQSRDDRFLIRLAKISKKVVFITHRSIWKSAKIFRRSKDEGAVFAWYRNVPVMQVYRYVFRNLLAERLNWRLPELLSRLSMAKESAFELHALMIDRLIENQKEIILSEENMSDGERVKDLLGEAIKGYKDFPGLFREEFSKIQSELEKEFRSIFDIAGTIEKSARFFKPARINRSYSRIRMDLTGLEKLNSESVNLRLQDRNFDLALSEITIDIYARFFSFSNKFSGAYVEKLTDFQKEFIDISNKLEKAIPAKESEMSGLPLLADEYKKKLSTLLIRTLTSMSRINLQASIKSIADGFDTHLKRLPEQKPILRGIGPDRLFTSREVSYIKPQEILQFEIQDRLRTDLNELTKKTTEQVEDLQEELSSAVNILMFVLDSAVSEYYHPDTGNSEISGSIKAGIGRALVKLKEIEKDLSGFRNEIKDEFHSLLGLISGEILELRDDENVFAVNLRFARSKASHRGRKLMRAYSRGFIRGVKFIISIPVAIVSRTAEYYKTLSRKIGYVESSATITTELSDFLSESQKALDTLPYIYQRLYQVEPLTDDLFFVGREREIALLETAFENWDSGRYSPVVILGEKGAGATTLINAFTGKLKKYSLKRLRQTNQIFKPEEFIRLLSKSVLDKEISDHEEFISAILGLEEKLVVVIDDLQHLYLRAIGGFSCLKIFFEIISRTNERVFWVTSCTIYAWEYLEKALLISSYFSYLVSLDPLDTSEMNDVIRKRNSISGYRIIFTPNHRQEESKKYRRLPRDERQEYLADQYFINLNKFAKSNISLALAFWLRSTIEVREKTIIMSSLYEPDTSFMNSMDADRLLTLTMILLHDGLKEDELAIILRKNSLESRMILLQLRDDGILFSRSGNYLINPLLYRQVVNALKSKNFIH